MDNDTPVLKNYVLRRIEPSLWKRVKSRAALEGRTVREVLLALLKVYAEHGFDVIENRDRPKG